MYACIFFPILCKFLKLAKPLRFSKYAVQNSKIAGTVAATGRGGVDENENCELKFGSYCLWRREHREEMKDTMVKKLKDQLFVARAYYPSIAKLPSQDKLTRALRQNIQEVERVLSESATDVDLPPG